MPNKDKLIDEADIDLNRLIEVFHKSGLTYRQILGILLTRCLDLYLQAEVNFRVSDDER